MCGYIPWQKKKMDQEKKNVILKLEELILSSDIVPRYCLGITTSWGMAGKRRELWDLVVPRLGEPSPSPSLFLHHLFLILSRKESVFLFTKRTIHYMNLYIGPTSMQCEGFHFLYFRTASLGLANFIKQSPNFYMGAL